MDSPSPQSVHVTVPCAYEPPLRSPDRAPQSACHAADRCAAAAAAAQPPPPPPAQASAGGAGLAEERVDEHVDQPPPPTPSDANSAVNGPFHEEFELEQEVDQPADSGPASTAPTALSSAGSPSQQGSPHAAAVGSPLLQHSAPGTATSPALPPALAAHLPSPAAPSQPCPGPAASARSRSSTSRRHPTDRAGLPRPRARVTKQKPPLHSSRARLPHTANNGHAPHIMGGPVSINGVNGMLGMTGTAGVLPAVPDAAAVAAQAALVPGVSPLDVPPLLDAPTGLHGAPHMGSVYRRTSFEGFPGAVVFSQPFAQPPQQQHLAPLQPNPFQQMQHWTLEQQHMLPYQVPLLVPSPYMRPPHLGPSAERISHFSLFNPHQPHPAQAPCLQAPWPYVPPQPSYLPIYPVSASTRTAYGASPNSAAVPAAMWNGNPLAVCMQGAQGSMQQLLQAQQLWRQTQAAPPQPHLEVAATRHGSQSAADTNLGGSQRRSSFHRGQ